MNEKEREQIRIESHTALYTPLFEQMLQLGVELKLQTIELAGILSGMATFLREDSRTLQQILGAKKKSN